MYISKWVQYHMKYNFSDFYFVFISIITTLFVNKYCVFIVRKRGHSNFPRSATVNTSPC